MNFVKVTFSIICMVIVGASCSPDLSEQKNKSKHLIEKLETAEIAQDSDGLNDLFAEDAVIYVPDNMPFAGKEDIIALYEYLWSQKNDQKIAYQVERTEETDGVYIEYGTSNGEDKINSRWKATYKAVNNSYVIKELVFGNAEATPPELVAPTGPYQVGQSTHYYSKEVSPNHRTLAFQIWYPAVAVDMEKARYRTSEITKASAKFLGLPSFVFSYETLITSNSYIDAQPIAKKSFPVVIYNHGYGGFTSVYQTIFEELASHGFIVVSVGHDDESSLLIKTDGSIIPNSPDNKFYSVRASELETEEISVYQSIILNSDDPGENTKAYQELIRLSPLHNESTRLWSGDTRDVINKLHVLNESDILLKGIFDFDSIGIMGHSLGGATAGQMAFGNNDIKAGINIDGFQFADLGKNKLDIPFMFISSNQNGGSYLRASHFMNSSETTSYQAILSGFSHGSFTDLALFQTNGVKSIDLQRELILKFFNMHLKNIGTDLKKLGSKYHNLKIVQN